jgi:hypothetical protein
MHDTQTILSSLQNGHTILALAWRLGGKLQNHQPEQAVSRLRFESGIPLPPNTKRNAIHLTMTFNSCWNLPCDTICKDLCHSVCIFWDILPAHNLLLEQDNDFTYCKMLSWMIHLTTETCTIVWGKEGVDVLVFPDEEPELLAGILFTFIYSLLRTVSLSRFM